MNDTTEGFTATVTLPSTGRPAFNTQVPAPFNSPGTFRARSGLWRRGIVFVPDHASTPQFTARVKKTKNGFVLPRTASWSVRSGRASAIYTLTSR